MARFLDFERATGSDRRPFETGHDLLIEGCQASGCCRPQIPRRAGSCRDDVGGLAAVGDDSVDEIGGWEGLAQRGDIDVRLYEGVECIDAEVRRHRRVGFLAQEGDLDVPNGQFRRVGQILRGGMHHECGRNIGKGTGMDQVDFSSMGFFGRGAENGEPES